MTQIALFDDSSIRRERYNDERWFSIIDIVWFLTSSNNPRRYRSDLKIKMSKYEGYNQVYENIVQLKMKAPDGKQRETDSANTQTALRIIQSIPSPKAEPLKQRLASLWNQRIEEFEDPELGIQRANERAIAKYKSKTRTDQNKKWFYKAHTNKMMRHWIWNINKYLIWTNRDDRRGIQTLQMTQTKVR